MYAQYNTVQESEHVRRKREADALFKQLGNLSDLINLKLSIYHRSPSSQLRAEITDFFRQYAEAAKNIMGVSTFMLTDQST
jgi:hypothetical protein